MHAFGSWHATPDPGTDPAELPGRPVVFPRLSPAPSPHRLMRRPQIRKYPGWPGCTSAELALHLQPPNAHLNLVTLYRYLTCRVLTSNSLAELRYTSVALDVVRRTRTQPVSLTHSWEAAFDYLSQPGVNPVDNRALGDIGFRSVRRRGGVGGC